ncbi:MAG: hypothetical protein FJ126_07420 [Deltaproteobacteria bacterium]|nr:hypothetical protein [Deltaproteobacteria bacterium]
MNKTLEQLKESFKETALYDVIYDLRQKYLQQDQRKMQQWISKGRPFPTPHIIKQLTVKKYARAFSLSTLIETGTHKGFMLYATKRIFKNLISIELDVPLYEHARKRFANYPQITIIQGDSGQKLPEVLAALREPSLFWLDAHFAKGIDCPVAQEIEHIVRHPYEHVILVDDAHFYTGEPGTPSLESLEKMVNDLRPGWVFQVRDCLIRIHRPASPQEFAVLEELP